MINVDRRHSLRRKEDQQGIEALFREVAVLDARLVTVAEQQAKIIEDNANEYKHLRERLEKAENGITVLGLENKWSKRVILALMGILAVKVSVEVIGGLAKIVQ